MTQVTIENQAVSEQVSAGGSFTVPTGEVFKVTIVGQAKATSQASGGNSGATTACSINGVTIASSTSSAQADSNSTNASASAATTFPFETVVVGGDTISATGGGLHIGGFVVNS
jgi:hypothetical protein